MEYVYMIASLIIVITIHEFSHAWTAFKLGDPTAKFEGRVSLNPLKHLDPLGTLMMFLVHIGWGKPVPVNPSYFKNGRRDEALTALAGPLSNLALAILIAIPLKYFGDRMFEEAFMFLNILLDVSIILFAFNMLPFPPLDGSKFLGWLIPRKYKQIYDLYLQNGTIYFLIFLVTDRFLLLRIFGFSVLSEFIGIIFSAVKAAIFLGT